MYMAMVLHNNPAPGHKIYNFGRPFLGHRYYTLTLSDLCPEDLPQNTTIL